jgi:hypothetical protein
LKFWRFQAANKFLKTFVDRFSVLELALQKTRRAHLCCQIVEAEEMAFHRLHRDTSFANSSTCQISISDLADQAPGRPYFLAWFGGSSAVRSVRRSS